jgi:hypothetical protein
MRRNDYLLCGTLKIKMYNNSPHTLEDLMANKIQEKRANKNIKISETFPTNMVKTI